MALVVMTDHVFPDIERERAMLENAGHELRFRGDAKGLKQVVDATIGAEAVLNCYAPMPADVIRRLDRCRIIAQYGVGLDTIDVNAATEMGIIVTNVPDYCIDEVSDHAVALTLALARAIVSLDRRVRAGSWSAFGARPLYRIRGRTFGVVGFGRIARATAAKASALGYKIVATDPYVPPDEMREAGAKPLSFRDLLHHADVISLHVPLTDETHHLIDEAAFGLVKSGAILVNTARGALIDTRALQMALEAGRLDGAALDVLEDEPPASDDSLLHRDDVIITPHAAFYSEESVWDLQHKAVEQVVDALAGRRPRYAVNGEALGI